MVLILLMFLVPGSQLVWIKGNEFDLSQRIT